MRETPSPAILPMPSKTFKEIVDESLKLINEFKKREKKEWPAEAIVIELQKQVGELSKHIMSREGYYINARDKMENYNSSKEKIGDEMSDVLLMLIRLAHHYNIDLESEHLKQIELAYKWFKENEK